MKLTIRFKLLIGFTLLLGLSFLVQGFSFNITRQYITSQITSFQGVEANKGASEIQDFFTRLSADSYGLASVYIKNEKDLGPAANYVIKNNNYILELTILSPLGRQLEKFDKFGQVTQDKLSYEIFSDPFKSAAAGTPAISQVYYIEKDLGPHVDVYNPIFGSKHTLIGVLKMQINLDQLSKELADIKLGESGYIYVVDNEGRLIAHPSEAFVLKRPDLTSRKIVANALDNIQSTSQDENYRNEKNIEVVAKAVKVPGYNWIAVFEQPVSEAFSFLTIIRNLFIITLVGSSLFLLLIALSISENLTRSIRKLQQSAQEIERGQLNKTVIIKSGDEIESLSHSFASLIDQLLQREHSLEMTTSQLEHANKRLEQLDKLKDEFVSLASHELRTPMTAIKSYLWMTLNGRGGELTEKQKFYIERAYGSVDRLIKLVNDMLNISRIESGRLTITMNVIDVVKLTQDVIDEILPRAKELGVTIEIQHISPPPKVIADSDKIKEVLFNLIGNSLKFTPKDGKISITFSQNGEMIETKIKDTGTGIEAEDIPKLFQKFALLPGSYETNQSAGMGTGLGLYICRAIIELHKGKVWVSSEGRGKGSEFTFSLKVASDTDIQAQNGKHPDETKGTVELIHTQI